MPTTDDFNALATFFVIEEQTGDTRRVDLSGRALPYRPLTLSGTQRNTVEWYPGNPIGVIQVYGAKEETTTINGYWKDIFLGEAGYATVDGETKSTAQDLAETIDDIRRKGQQIKVTWLNQVRFGIMSRFTQKWHTGHDLEWDIEFTWIAQEDITLTEVPFTNSVPSADLVDAPSQLQANVDKMAPASSGFFSHIANLSQGVIDAIHQQSVRLQDVLETIDDNTDTIQGLVEDVSDSISAVTQYFTSTDDTQRRVAGALDGVKLTSANQRDLYQDAADGARLNIGGPFGAALGDRATLRSQAAIADDTAVLAAAQQKQVLASVKSQVLAVFQARQGDDLRRVSQIYYGTPDGWQGLMVYNELTTDVLEAGQMVIVPTSLTTGVQR